VRERLTVKDVLVGDVWVLGGQSNMEGCGRLSEAEMPEPFVRAFFMDDHWGLAKEPLHDLSIAIDPVHTDLNGGVRPAAKTFTGTGPGTAFGNELQLDAPGSANYVKIMQGGQNILVAAPDETPPPDNARGSITLLRDSQGLRHRLVFDQGNPSLVQHYEMDVYIGDQVNLGLCDIEVNLGAVHAYAELTNTNTDPPTLYDWPQAYNTDQADVDYHKMTGALNLIKLQWVDHSMQPVDLAQDTTQDDYAQYTRGPGDIGGPGGGGGPPVTTSFPNFQDPFRIANLVFNPAGGDGLKTISCDMLSNVSNVETNGLDNTNSFVLKQMSATSVGYTTDNQVLGVLASNAPQGAAGQRKTFTAHVYNPIFGIERQMAFYETGVGTDTYMTRRLQLVAVLNAMPDPNTIQTMTATLTSDVPGPNGDSTTGAVSLTETAANSKDFKSADGHFEVKITRVGLNGGALPNDITAAVWSTVLAVSGENIDAIESGVGTLEFRTDLVADEPPVITNGDMALMGKDYYVKVTDVIALKENNASVFVYGVVRDTAGRNAYKAGGAAAPAAANVLTLSGKAAMFRFMDPNWGPPGKGVYPLADSSTLVGASGDTVIAQVEDPAGGKPLAVAAIQTYTPFKYPYARPYWPNVHGTPYYSPAVYSAVAISDASTLKVRIREGEDYKKLGSNLLKELNGSDTSFDDWDSAQVAVRWYKAGTVFGTPVNNTNVITPGRTPASIQKYGEHDVRLSGGATWNWMPGITNSMIGKREVYFEFPTTIPDDVDGVNIVLVYTDLIEGHDQEDTNGYAHDIAGVLGSWTGAKKDGLWTFISNDAEVPVVRTYDSDHYRLPKKNLGGERDIQVNQVTEILRKKTGHTLVRRLELPPECSTPDTDPRFGNANDTGYDIQLDPTAP